ncbi:hypothetical protein GCM10008931_43430 [Oceanobacillus oncorhynchi subsp. oncorhynchi]|uniref:hypothetical protein n=1 Tax=Oceanobacillus oncorhynchi TaxID=545501 RepID=UPI0031D919E8
MQNIFPFLKKSYAIDTIGTKQSELDKLTETIEEENIPYHYHPGSVFVKMNKRQYKAVEQLQGVTIIDYMKKDIR